MALTGGATASESLWEQNNAPYRNVEVIVDDQSDIDLLIEAGFDLAEYKALNEDGTITLNIVGTDEDFAEIQSLGFRLGDTLQDINSYRARLLERQAAIDAENASHQAAETGKAGGIGKSGLRSGALASAASELQVQRVDYFQNYAGWFLSIEVFDRAVNASGSTGPTVSFSWKTATGAYGSATTIPRYIDGDPTPDVYMYNKILIRIGAASAPYGPAAAPTPPAMVRVGTSTAGVTPVEAPVNTWLGGGLPPHTAGYLSKFQTKYTDPTENRAKIVALQAEFPELAEIIDLPNLTNGYQRKSMCVMAGTTACNGSPGTASQAVYLEAKLFGQDGGNNIRAQFRNPGAANSPLSVTVTPNALGQSDIIVDLGTSGTGALNSTAAQVVAAINASPAASALVQAFPYGGQTGTGTVAARALVNLSDFLAAPASVTRGPFQMKMIRIGKVRDGSKVGVFLFCQQHAREWTTSLTCVETAEQLLRNYAIDPETKELLDNLDIFILPNVNPDGGHYSLYDFASQRKNMTRHCPITATSGMPTNRNTWGVDLNRNNEMYTLFDGYFGADTNCTSELYAGPSEVSEPEIKNEHWVVDTYPNIKFANNIHSYGGYFMWAPGSYTGNGRVTAPSPNIGVEGYFFAAADNILNRIKEYRGTAILPERTGPIADVLYSAAGNSADDMYYRKGIIGYSFETGADRFSSTTSGTGQSIVNFQPNFANEGVHEAYEFAAGNYGMLESALAYENDHTAPTSTTLPGGPVASKTPIDFTFKWLNEPSIIHYTLDGSTPTMASLTWNREGPRRPGETFTLTKTTTVQWIATDIVGNTSAVQSARFAVDPNAPVTTASLAPAPQNGYYRSPVLTLMADDDFDNGGSGIELTEYNLDGAGWTPYAGAITICCDGPHSVDYRSTDKAGNVEATHTLAFSSDSVAPTTTISLAPPAGTGGFYSADPTVTLSASDAAGGSGVAVTEYSLDGEDWVPYTAPFVVSGDWEHFIDYRSKDAAGNVETTQTKTFSIDTTKPFTDISMSPPEQNGFFRNPTITLSPDDNNAGVASTEYRLDGGAWTPYTAPVVVTGDGPHTFDYRSTDNAGNVEDTHTTSFVVDGTAPVTTATVDGTLVGGFYIAPPTVTLSATDGAPGPGVSGVASTEYRIDSAPFQPYTAPFVVPADGTHVVQYRSTDVAGNVEATKSVTIKTDGVAPTTTAAVSGSTSLGWITSNPNVTLTATDPAPGSSGVANIQRSVDGAPFTTYTGAFAVTGDGPHTVRFFATDNAGNVEAIKSVSFKIDTQIPVTTAALSGTPVGGVYPQSRVTLTGNDGLGSGVVGIQYTVDGSGTRSYTEPFWVTGDGLHTVTYRSVDLIGRIETTKTLTFTSDGTPPVSTASLSPAPVNGYYSNPTVTINANDFAGGSGIASIEYLLDSGSWTTYTGPFSVSGNGSHTLQFHATDNVGNVESVKTMGFNVDAAGPVITIASPAVGAEYLLNATVTPSYSCADAHSGVATCSGPGTIDTRTVGTRSYTVTSTDHAGNSSTLTRTYKVIWPFTGFNAPLNGNPSSVAAGGTVAIKFSLGGNRGTAILNAGSPGSGSVSCAAPVEPASPGTVPGESFGAVSYSTATGLYTINWTTPASFSGTCRMLVVQLKDGTKHTVVVSFS